MTPFDDETVESALSDRGLAVETHDDFGSGDDRTVLVGVG